MKPAQKVRCGSHFHHIDWTPQGPVFTDHREPAEAVLAVLGAPSGCRRKVEAWEQTGIGAAEVHTWVALGIADPVRAGRLRAHRFSPGEAAAWQVAGFRSVTELFALRRAGVRVEVAGPLAAQGLAASRIAACAGGGAPVERALAWHRTGLDCWFIERLRALHQLPSSVGNDGEWCCPHCGRGLALGRVGQHLEGQRCYQESGRSLSDGWAAVPDNWAPVWLVWRRNFRSRHYNYATNRVQLWLHSPWGGGVTLETVLAAITTWRRAHYCRWEAATEAVMALSSAEVQALAAPPRLLVGPVPESTAEPLEVAA
jgi:hypothetical protein